MHPDPDPDPDPNPNPNPNRLTGEGVDLVDEDGLSKARRTRVSSRSRPAWDPACLLVWGSRPAWRTEGAWKRAISKSSLTWVGVGVGLRVWVGVR
eukprot:scaffold109987_cov30-Phaeocystis_antarctica.AAC.1